MSHLKPPFTLQTAQQKVKAAQKLWNTRSPPLILPAYTPSSIWRNRTTFLQGHSAISSFLTTKWTREHSYRLRKELFAFQGNRIAVQFWYEYQDGDEGMVWKRCYGLEDWTFAGDGRMEKRMMSGNDLVLEGERGEEKGEGRGEGNGEGRWFIDGVDVDEVEIGAEHW